jgi:hypothetical protein
MGIGKISQRDGGNSKPQFFLVISVANFSREFLINFSAVISTAGRNLYLVELFKYFELLDISLCSIMTANQRLA